MVNRRDLSITGSAVFFAQTRGTDIETALGDCAVFFDSYIVMG